MPRQTIGGGYTIAQDCGKVKEGFKPLPDKVHHRKSFSRWNLIGSLGMEILENPCHVCSHPPHGLHAFRVLCRFAWRETIGNVPVLRPDKQAVEHLEWHVEALYRCR